MTKRISLSKMLLVIALSLVVLSSVFVLPNKAYANSVVFLDVKNSSFENTNFDCVYSYMNKENIASVNTAKANGMKFVKEYFDGEENLCVYAITRKEWENDIKRKEINMNTLEAIAKRKSTRDYKPMQISEEELNAIIKAGCSAPIAMAKFDSLHITVIQNEEFLKIINDKSADALA